MEPDRWYAYEADRQIGPLEWSALKSRAEAGILRREDFVWRAGMSDWARADSVDGLFGTNPPPLVASAHTTATATASEPSTAPATASGEVFSPEEPALLFAGFWRRAAAFVIDQAILLAVFFVAFFTVGVAVGLFGKPAALAGGVVNLTAIFGPWLYYAGMESSQYQATLGKRALGIHITDLSGRRIDFLRATGRHFSKIVSALLLMTGYVMAAFTSRKQALHDVIASCLVVRGRPGSAPVPDHEVWAKRHWGDAPSPPADGT